MRKILFLCLMTVCGSLLAQTNPPPSPCEANCKSELDECGRMGEGPPGSCQEAYRDCMNECPETPDCQNACQKCKSCPTTTSNTKGADVPQPSGCKGGCEYKQEQCAETPPGGIDCETQYDECLENCP